MQSQVACAVSCPSRTVSLCEIRYILTKRTQDDQQHFPLAAVCINITKMVMDALAAGSFSSILDEIDKGVLLAWLPLTAPCPLTFEFELQAIPVAETTCSQAMSPFSVRTSHSPLAVRSIAVTGVWR